MGHWLPERTDPEAPTDGARQCCDEAGVDRGSRVDKGGEALTGGACGRTGRRLAAVLAKLGAAMPCAVPHSARGPLPAGRGRPQSGCLGPSVVGPAPGAGRLGPRFIGSTVSLSGNPALKLRS